MLAFFKYGIFLPSVDILSVYNLYTFSCLVDGLYLISGLFLEACITLNTISKGIFIANSGLIIALINLIPCWR